ncbi:MAG: rubrerythrin-like domain-containing protein [Halobacteriales archaeon]|nr:rubrerythrin-like domain-containing protein [Halobacteriales archaeon]
MHQIDPYTPEPPYEYECTGCGERVTAESHPGVCANCGGEVQDVSIPRE